MKNLRSLLLIASLVPSLGVLAQIEEYTMPDGRVIKIDRSIFPDFDPCAPTNPMPAEIVARRSRRRAKPQLPPYVYNGQDKYFPPIVSQDGGSCGSAAGICHQFTHEINSYRDLDASLVENQYPSHFTWLLAYQDNDDLSKCTGIPNVPTYGGRTYSRLFGSQTHDDPDYGWMQGYDKWYSAMWNRVEYSVSFPPTNTPEARQVLKEWIYDHCGDNTMHSGGVVGIGVAAYGTWAAIPNSTANKEAGVVGMKYVKNWGDTFNHALTVCGYDDRIEFDLDGDGIVGETEEDEVGAWIIANSWGDGWENKGFIYCPYKYSYAVGTDQVPWTPGSVVIRHDYRPLRTIKLKMDYSHRSELLLCLGISDNLSATRPEKIIQMQHFRYAGNTKKADPAPEVPMLGRWVDGMHYEPMEFGYDLTDLTFSADRTKPLKYFFIVKTKDNAIGNGTIYEASVINYEIDSEGVEIPFPDKNVAINNNGGETIISVVVPGEQLYPPTNLMLSDGVLIWSAPQVSSLTLAGYHVYEGNNLVAQLPASQTFFTPSASEEAYTVRAVYEAGTYEQESEGTNAVVLQQTKPDTNLIATMSDGGLIIPNAFSEILDKVTIEFWMRSTKNDNWSHQVGPGWGTFLFHSASNGCVSVGWAGSGEDRLNVDGVLSTLRRWVHIAIVINGKTLTLFVNGLKKGSITSTTFYGMKAFGNLQFGHISSNERWHGSLDEVRVWRTARTQAEIKNNMKLRIEAPAMQPDLLIYVPMDTIVVNGETKFREYVSGKHASFLEMGKHTVQESVAPLSTTLGTTTLSINDVDGSHLAGVPFTLTASTSLRATDWSWQVLSFTPAEATEPAALPEGLNGPWSGVTPSFTFPEAGTYNVSCAATLADTMLVADKNITVVNGEPPVAAFDVQSDTIPAGDRFSFINRSEGEACTYLWSIPGAEVEEMSCTNATALYPKIGTFTVTLTATNPFGQSSATKEVTVRASAPKARFDVSQTAIMLGESTQLLDESRYSPTTWHWELSNGCRMLTTDEQSPYIVPTAPGIYDISLYVTNELGDNTLSRGRYLIVSNDDAGSCLNFTGSEQLQLSCPFTEAQKALTLDWWMRPAQYQGSVSIASADGILSTSVDNTGKLSIRVGTRTSTSPENYIITGEWHHYAVTYAAGVVNFCRDGELIGAGTRIGTTIPVFDNITIGGEVGFKGQIDEVRLWSTTLTAEKVKGYCNQHIADIEEAQTTDGLLLYYDFNQNGGDVKDRTSNGFDAQRIGFGPDGDAWNSALGVFTIDTEAQMHGDISATYLTNYKNPYLTASGTVNSNNSSRFKRLLMGAPRSRWQQANAIVKNGITTGAHIDTEHHSDIQFETQWSGFATPLLDYRLWQPVKLPAGRYRFSITPGDNDGMQTSRIVACEGAQMLSDADCDSLALAWALLSDGAISFALSQETTVSLGIIVNLTGQCSFGINSFKLEGVTVEPLSPASPDGIVTVRESSLTAPHASGVYDLSGRMVSDKRLQRGIYIQNGKKILK